MIFTRHTIPNAARAFLRFLRSLFAKDEPVFATAEVMTARIDRCLACPHAVHGQCGLCTCVISLKTLVASESCPIAKWAAQTSNSTGLLPRD